MATASSVQFRSPESLLQMYDMVKIPSWSISQRSQLLHSFSGTNFSEARAELEAFLDMLVESESAAIYTLRLYKKIKPGQDIDNRTPYNGSYNFNFTDHIVGSVPGKLPVALGGNGINLARDHYALKEKVDRLTELFEVLVERLNDKESEEESVPQQESIGNVLMASIAPLLPELVGKLVDGLLKDKKPETTEGTVINGVMIETGDILSPEESVQCLQCCEQLKPLVGDVPTALGKLIRYAKKNPIAFRTYLKML